MRKLNPVEALNGFFYSSIGEFSSEF